MKIDAYFKRALSQEIVCLTPDTIAENVQGLCAFNFNIKVLTNIVKYLLEERLSTGFWWGSQALTPCFRKIGENGGAGTGVEEHRPLVAEQLSAPR